MLMVVLLAVGSYIIALLKPVAVDLFLGVPQIGAIGCAPPEAGTPSPAFIFGKPGWASLGCVHQYMIYAALGIVAFSFVFGLLVIMIKNATNPSEFTSQMVKYMGMSIILLVLIPVFHSLYDGVAGLVTSGAIWIASIPHGPAVDYQQQREFAGTSLMIPFDKMRDPTVADHECVNGVDVDGDGAIDRYDLDGLCLIGTNLLSPEFFQTLMVFTIGNMIGIMTTLIVFVAAVIKFLLTGVLAVAFPLILALSRLPKIGDIFDEWLKAFYGLMAAPILIAIVAAVAPVVILGELNTLNETGGANSDSEKYVAFIMFIAMAYTYLAIIIGCARVLGSVMMSASTVVMGAAMAGFGAMMGTARAGGMAVLGGAGYGSAAGAFSRGFGFMPGAGGMGHSMGFARNESDLSAGAPANDMISSATGSATTTAAGSTPAAGESSWSGPTETDIAGNSTPETTTVAHETVAPKPATETSQYGQLGTLGGGAVGTWGRAIEQSAMATHPSAKNAISMRRETDDLDINSIWPLHREKPIRNDVDEPAVDGELPDNSDTTAANTQDSAS